MQPEPLGYGRQSIDAKDREALLEVLSSERLTQGEAVPRFEASLCEATGSSNAVATANGTLALQLAYLALGIRDGVPVATSANTFLATATTAIQCGADVQFLDLEEGGANLDVYELEERLDGPNPPRVVTAVHFAGLPCDMGRILNLKRRYGFLLIEDAAHALGSRYLADGREWRVGEHPEVDATILSFHPVKHITTGEGGAVLTHSSALADRLRLLREHGVERDLRPGFPSRMVDLGLNARMSDLQAALGWSQLARLDAFLEARRRIAGRYLSALEGYGLPQADGLTRDHAWHLFCIRANADERDPLMRMLAERGIHTQVHYRPVPLEPWFVARGVEGSWPRAELHAATTLSLPLYPDLTDAEQDRVLDALTSWRRARHAA